MITIHDLMWIVTGLSLIATVANIKKRPWCFDIWFFTNFLWMCYDAWMGALAQATLFGVYVVLAVWGIMEWRKK